MYCQIAIQLRAAVTMGYVSTVMSSQKKHAISNHIFGIVVLIVCTFYDEPSIVNLFTKSKFVHSSSTCDIDKQTERRRRREKERVAVVNVWHTDTL